MKVKAMILVSVAAIALLAAIAILKDAAAAGDDTVAAVTKLENDSVKADLANDKSFAQKYLAEDWTGGDSSGRWFTKKDALKMMEDTKNNKMNSEKISELKVRSYGTAAVATYKDTYDAIVLGEHRMRTVISTDMFVKQGGEWKLVAGHSSQAQ